MKFIDLKALKDGAKTGSAQPEQLAGAGVRKEYPVEIKDLADGSTEFVITTDSVDRMGDTIASEGWQLAAFMKNPVVLFAHDSHSLPVGRAVAVTHVPHGLKAQVQWVPKDTYPFAETVRQMVKGGFLSATSVGFQPLEYKWSDDKERPGGIDFTKQELLEFSIVPIPANAEALVTARAAGIDVSLIKEWAAKWIEPAGGDIVEKSGAELAAEVVAAAAEVDKPEDGKEKSAEAVPVAAEVVPVATAAGEVAELKEQVARLTDMLGKMAVKIDALSVEPAAVKEATAVPGQAPAREELSDEDTTAIVRAWMTARDQQENEKRGRLPADF